MKALKLRNLMIEAGDPLRHDVCFSRMGQGWILENERDGLVSIHDTAVQALTAMQKAVGLNGSTWDWNVKDNPYSGD